MKRELKPARFKGGTITVPGDKSIAHRAVLFSLLSRGPVEIVNFPYNADCQSSMKAAEKLGVKVTTNDGHLVLTPPEKLTAEADTIIDCGNSGTTARLLSGIIAGSDLKVILAGDDSLSSRPMNRIIKPLTEMGAEFFSEDDFLPLTIQGKKLLPFEYTLPVPSAQLKSALLLAGIKAGCTTTVREVSPARDHTEIMVDALGEGISIREIKPVAVPDPVDPRKKKMQMPEDFKREITVGPNTVIKGGLVDIPGDISTAGYFFAAAAISGQSVTVENVGLNPTRTDLLTYLKLIGCKVDIADKTVISGEARGNVTVTGGKLKPRRLAGAAIPGLIDEIPIIGVMAAFADGTTVVRDAAELRIKESDRIVALADNLTRMGVKCGVMEDGIAIEGKTDLSGADFDSYGDHRIAMSFAIASIFLDGPSSINDDAVVDVSCPNFFDIRDKIIS